MSNRYYGYDAVKKVEEMIGRKLTIPEIRVVEEEGFVDGTYKDTKGVVTSGVGQTGKYMNMSFDDTFREHEDIARKMIPSYDQLPDVVKAELAQAAYRTDLQQSPEFRKLFNAGKYEEAAQEFLDNADYRKSLKEGTGVANRMEAVSNIVRDYGQSLRDAEQAEEVVPVSKEESWMDSFGSSLRDLFK